MTKRAKPSEARTVDVRLVVPSARTPGLTADQRRALDRHRRSTIDGICECGGERRPFKQAAGARVSTGELAHRAIIAHAPGCCAELANLNVIRRLFGSRLRETTVRTTVTVTRGAANDEEGLSRGGGMDTGE